MSKETKQTWFSTGFTGGGVASVDANVHTLFGVVIVRQGEAKGHDLWIDADFVASVAKSAETMQQRGVKSRFGHPNMCSNALGTFIGRLKNFSVSTRGEQSSFRGGPTNENGIAQCTADLFISSAASESPNGDLRAYIEKMAAENPDMCGASVVFTRDVDAEEAFMLKHTRRGQPSKDGMDTSCYKCGKRFKYADQPEIQMGVVACPNCSAHCTQDDCDENASEGFKSPDPLNVKNLPHARLAKLHSADIVDDPAATDGMFSGMEGAEAAEMMTEFLDLHPDVWKLLQDEGIVRMLEKYADKIEPFLKRYTANKKETDMSEKKEELAVPANPANPEDPKGYCPVCSAGVIKVDGDTATCPNGHQFPAASMKKTKDEAASSGAAGGVPAAKQEEALATPPAGVQATEKEKELQAKLDEMGKQVAALSAKNQENEQKLAVLTKGETPLSAASAPGEGSDKKTPWQMAMKKSRNIKHV